MISNRDRHYVSRGDSRPSPRFVLFLVGIAAMSAASAQSQHAALLDSGTPIQLHLAGGASQTVRVAAQAGDYLRIVAAADSQLVVKTLLFDPQGQLVAVTPSLGGTGGSARMAAYAAMRGEFRLRVTSQMSDTTPRTCTIVLELRRPASEQDRIDAGAHRAFAMAAQQAVRSADGLRAAVLSLDRPIELAERAGDDLLEMRAIFGKGQFLAMSGDPTAALPFFERAVELCRKSGDKRAEAHTLDDLGLVNAQLERYPRAIELYDQALELQRQTGQPWETALSLTNLADAQSALGRIDIALECLQRQEQIRKDLNDDFGLNETRLGMADVYLMTGDPERALEKLVTTLPQWPRFRDREDGKESEITAYRQLGRAYASLGDESAAATALRNALQRARALGNARIIADTIVVQAQIANLNSGSTGSMDVIERALAASKRAGYQRGEALTLIELAKSRIAAGQFRPSASDAEQALGIATSLGQPYDEANARRVLGVADARVGATDAAQRQYSSALAIERRMGDRFGEVQTLVETARLQDRLGLLEPALSTLEAALAAINQTRSSLAAPELRASYLASQRAAYELSARVLERLNTLHPGHGYDANAFEVSEKAHARALLDELGKSGGDLDRPEDRKLAARRDALDATIHRLATSEASQHREERIADLLTLRDELQVQLSSSRAAGSGQATQSTTPLTLAQIRRRVLQDDTVLLEYLTGPLQTQLWVVSRRALHHYTLPPEAVIRDSVRRLYDALTAAARLSPKLNFAARDAALSAADDAALREAKAVARLLLPMPASLLGTASLVVVADGPVQLVPFALLPDPGHAERRLGSSYGIAVEPSASVLARIHESPEPTADERILIVADPVYSRGDAPLPAGLTPAAEPAKYHADSVGFDHPLETLPALPMSRVEAGRLEALAPGRTLALLDFDAIPSRFERGAQNRLSILHIATHTVIDDRHSELSGLVLSRLDRNGKPVDGFVPLLDIYKLRLDARLVVLSACETYIGSDLRGEGLLGLARGFLYAGAHRVLASLWKVDDRATATFMDRFYTALLGQRLSAAAALTKAQDEMAQDPAWRSPRYWAGFVLEGDPQ